MSGYDQLSKLLGSARVIPPVPPGRSAFIGRDSGQGAKSHQRDQSSSWSAFIHYEDSAGEISMRRITCKRISGHCGEAELITCFCHERQAWRTFRIDRIRDMCCAESGEILDPATHFEQLARTGALKVEDKALNAIGRVLVFLARCDGDYHPLEVAALDHHFERYARWFGGDDRTIMTAMREARRIAPDADDLIRSLKAFGKMPLGAELARFVLDSGAAIVDADGHHSPEEIGWAVEISSALKNIADRTVANS
jgi:Tellurite resistance protein TerB